MRVLIVIKSRQFTKGQIFFLVMAVFVCGLLFYANAVAFKLISAPVNVGEIVAYSALAVAVDLTIVMLAIVIRDKRRILSGRKQISNVKDRSSSDQASDVVASQTIAQELEKVDSIDSNELQEVAPSSVDLQESTSVVESNLADIQISNGIDVPEVLACSKAKSNKKRIVVMFIIVVAVGLLFFANAVAFGLISFAGYFVYAFVSVAAVLAILTIAVVIVDKRKGRLPKEPIVEVGVIKESKEVLETPDTVAPPTISQTSINEVDSDVPVIESSKLEDETQGPIVAPAKVFGKRELLIIMIAFTAGLLFFANAVAFGLISLPPYIIYATVASAVIIAAIAVYLILGVKIKVLVGDKIKSVFSALDLQESPNETKKPDQVSNTGVAPVNAQSTMKVDPVTEMLRQLGLQKTTSEAEQEKFLLKKPVIPPTKVICPACRKVFNLPIYERNYIVDFGTPKKSNLIKQCPHCQTPIRLKRSSEVEEEDIWED
jgi:hypothetical protein